MSKPRPMTVATAVFVAGIGNASIYTFGYRVILIAAYLTRGGGGATFGGAITAFIVTLIFTLLISSIITFLLAFPIAAICLKFGWVGPRAFVVAPAIGAAVACAIASLLGVMATTYIAIVAFSYTTGGMLWWMLGRSDPSVTHPAGLPA